MTHGAPAVCSSASCIPEVCGDAAIYFDPHSPADMAEKIEFILADNNLREQQIKKGYEQIKKYSWERMAQETLSVYTKALQADN